MKMLYPVKLFVLFLISLFSVSSIYSADLQAADCGCDFTLKPKNGETEIYVNGQTLGVKPGNKVCIPGGTYKHIYLFNFNGTAEQPITVTNCTGKVIISGNVSYGFILKSSKNIHVMGTGDPSFEYGILVDGTAISQATGFATGDRSTDIELDHIEIYKSGAGFMYAPTPNCDSATWGSSFTIRNLSYHHNYVHDTGGEAFYIGNTSNTYNLTCNGSAISVTPQVINGLKIYNNLIERSGWDGIQVASSPVGVEIYNNVVKQHGVMNRDSQQAGIILGGASSGKVYNNVVLGGTGNSFQCFGVGLIQVYNNVFANGGYNGSAFGQHGVIFASRPAPAGYPKMTMQFMNNTIINPKASGVVMYDEYAGVGTNNVFLNNIVTNPGALANGSTLAYWDIKLPSQNMQLSNNINKPTSAELKFVDAANNNYNLQPGSIAIDAGMDLKNYGITKDMNNNSRPGGAAFDAGAFEHTSTVHVNQAPVANAGADFNITLPNSQVTLSGSGTDADGTVTAYNWKQQSGPSQSGIVSAGGAATAVNSLTVAGMYEFVLTVTDNEGASDTSIAKVIVSASTPGSVPGLLKYRYYTFTGTWYHMPNLHALTPAGTGTVANITLANRTQNDRFAYLWDGYINIPVSGTYTFRTTSDDGSQFWIGDLPLPLINNDDLHSPRDRDGTITLNAGVYPIAVLYYDQDGGEMMNVSWKTPQTGSNFEAIPTTSFVNAPVRGGPLKYRYYTFSGTWYNMPSLHALTPVATGTVANVNLANKTQNDRFAFLWEGFINITVGGSYTFRTTSDDGSQFWIGSLPGPLIVNDGLHGPEDKDGTITLNAGVYPIAYLYYEQEGGETMNISWKTPQTGNSFITIPDNAFVTQLSPVAAYENPAIHKYNMARCSLMAMDSGRSNLAMSKIKTDENFRPSLVLFPNPAIEQVNLRLTHTEKGLVQVNIVNGLGVTVRSNQYRKENIYWQQNLAVSGLKPGYYLVEIKGKMLDFKQSFIKK
ncbi:MAG: PA14 domain-containing protein [Chitinophagaceae bacterium]